MGRKRATTKSERAARRRQILTAAAALLEGWSVDDVNIDRIADLAGIAKGTVYLYFRTREELILEVFDWHHALWFEAVEMELGNSTQQLSPDDIGRILAATLTERPLLLRLFGRVGALLNGSIAPERLQRIRVRQANRIVRVARTLQRRVHGLTALQAQRWVLRVEIFITGIAALIHSTTEAAGGTEGLERGMFDVDLETELQYIARTMMFSRQGA